MKRNYELQNDVVLMTAEKIYEFDYSFDKNNVSHKQLIEEIKFQLSVIKQLYKVGVCYYNGNIFGQEYCIRMNKNHGWKHKKYTDYYMHNISLVSEENHTLNMNFIKNNKIHRQEQMIYKWNDVYLSLYKFFYDILYEFVY